MRFQVTAQINRTGVPVTVMLFFQINITGPHPVTVSIYSGKYSIVISEANVKTNCNSPKTGSQYDTRQTLPEHIEFILALP